MPNRICETVYQIGGGDLSDPRDCLVYLVDLGDLVMIDCGAGTSWPKIINNICDARFDPHDLHSLILTHCHIDHIGAAGLIREQTSARIIAHELDAEAIETGDSEMTAAGWYSMKLEGVSIDQKITQKSETLEFASGTVTLIHTPGHTPGSMVAVVETPDNQRVLFGQDIHGPFDPSFNSNIDNWRASMQELIALDADVLCEGHYGVFKGKQRIKEFIEEHLAMHP